MFLSFFDAINPFSNNYEFTPAQQKIELICVIILFVVFSALFTVFFKKAIKAKKKNKKILKEKNDGEK